MVGFKLANTLSEEGAVSRGVCSVNSSQDLTRVVETTGIIAAEVGAGKLYSPETVVSMNCWGFLPDLFPLLDREWRGFLAGLKDSPAPIKAEFYLPGAISALIEQKQLKIRVLPTESQWFGVTYQNDRPRVVAALASLIDRGHYPKKLWNEAA